MLSSLFDEYSLNARVRPALLALLSPTAFVYLVFPQLYSTLLGAMSIFVAFGLVTALAHYCRSAGRNLEFKLFSAWDGKPSTSLLRHRDTHIDSITKSRYHEFLSTNVLGWSAPSAQEELSDPKLADQAYESAVRWLLEFTRDEKQFSLLFKENISYGFRRNCYGIKWLAILLTLAPIAPLVANSLSLIQPVIDLKGPHIWISICLSVALCFWWMLVVTESWVRDAAMAYGIRLLAACDVGLRR